MLVLGVILLGGVLVIPSGIAAYFDGLPWVNSMETLALSIVVPFLVALGWRFLALRISVLSLSALLLLKILLFVGSPASGWLVKMYPNMTTEELSFTYFKMPEGDRWIRTYATSWNSQASGVLKKPWTEKLNFPLDWILPVYGPCKKTGQDCFDALNPIIEVNGAILLPKGNKFSIIAEGVQEGKLWATNENNETFALLPAKNSNEASLQKFQLPKDGKWNISGQLTYKGTNWSLIPTLVLDNGELSSELGREILWQNESDLTESLGMMGFYKVLSRVLDFGIILFLFVWAIWIARVLAKAQIFNFPIVLLSFSALSIPIFFGSFFIKLLMSIGVIDVTTISYLGFSIVIVSLGLVLWAFWKNDYRNFQADRVGMTVFLLYGPASLIFFANKWYSLIGKWQIWSPGDDWISYQDFARKIITGSEWITNWSGMGPKITVGGPWLNAGEGVFVMQPLYRYFVGIYHWLFGQSAFAQHMADVWCIFGAATLIASLIVKFRLSTSIAFFASTIYLIINFISSFRYHIGRGLVENHAMIFMLLAAWYLCRSREEGGYYRIIMATLCGIFGYWMRQDHLGAIAGLAFLALESADGLKREWNGYWERFKLNWQLVAMYWGGGILSVLLICYRNWYLGGGFFPASTQHPNFVGAYERGKFYLILTGNEWPTFPSISGILVSLGVFVALVALVWRPNPLADFPRSLGVIFIGLLSPYMFLWTGGYQPRFSIHILPLAILSWAFLLNNISNSNHLMQRLGWRGN